MKHILHVRVIVQLLQYPRDVFLFDRIIHHHCLLQISSAHSKSHCRQIGESHFPLELLLREGLLHRVQLRRGALHNHRVVVFVLNNVVCACFQSQIEDMVLIVVFGELTVRTVSRTNGERSCVFEKKGSTADRAQSAHSLREDVSNLGNCSLLVVG